MTQHGRRLGHRITRRRFLQATSAATVAVPLFVPGVVLGKDGGTAASERIAVGMIGSGDRANQLAQPLLGMNDVQITATCDPVADKRRALKASVETAYASRRGDGGFKGCTDYNDFRELLASAQTDAVVITSPENWHALQSVAAAKAGKDIYCEKAMAKTIAEGRAVVKAVRENGRVFQVGQQQRSDPIFALAVKMVHDGDLGELRTIKVGVPGNRTGPLVNPQPVPEGLDWDLWQGPAPERPYQPERLVNMVWMSTYDYCAGYQAGWGAHHVDIAQWGNRTDHTGPVEVESTGVFPTEGICDCPISWHSDFLYANGVRLVFTSYDENAMGIRFEGSEGRVYVNRGRIEAGPDSFKPVLEAKLPSDYVPNVHRDGTPAHLRNFLDCVKSRNDPVAPVEIGHRTNVVCDLSDIATRLKRKLGWNPETEQFIDDDEAGAMLSREMRAPLRI